MKSIDFTLELIYGTLCANGNDAKSVDLKSRSIAFSRRKNERAQEQTDFSAESIRTCRARSGIATKSIDIGLRSTRVRLDERDFVPGSVGLALND